MKVLNHHIYLSLEELQAFNVPEPTLRSGILRNKNGAGSYDHVKLENRVFLKLASIPEETRLTYSIPEQKDLLQKFHLEELKKLHHVDEKVFDVFFNSPDSDHAQDLTKLAAWLMLCAPMKLKKAKSFGYTSVDGFYSDVIKITVNEDLKGSVTNLRIFKNKLKPFKQYCRNYPTHFNPSHNDFYLSNPDFHPEYYEALTSLISKRNGLRNAAKLVQRSDDDKQAEEQQALLIRLYSDPIKLNFQQTYDAYMAKAAQMMELYEETDGADGWDDRCIIKRQTVNKFLLKPEIKQIWFTKRHGKKPAADIFSPVTKRKDASFANAKWVIDGTPMPIYFSHNGKNYNRLNAFIVMDEHSWAVIGYALDYTENAENVVLALRKACQLTGCMPHEIQSDNASAITGIRGRMAIESIATKFTPSKAYNARAKRIETWFKHFNDKILKFKPGYFASHSNSLNHQPNEDHLASLVKGNLIPPLSRSIQLVEESLNEWNKIVFNGAVPLEKFGKSLKETKSQQRIFSPSRDVQAFWYQPGKKVSITDSRSRKQKKITVWKPTEYTYSNKGIIIERADPYDKRKRVKHVFDIPEAAFAAENITKKFTLKIEPENWSEAQIFFNDKPVLDRAGRPVIATQKTELPSAFVDHTKESRAQLARELERKAEQEQIIEDKFERYQAIAQKNGHTAPIDASWVHGKAIAEPAKAELNELRLKVIGEQTQEDPEEDQYHEEPEEELVPIGKRF